MQNRRQIWQYNLKRKTKSKDIGKRKEIQKILGQGESI